MAGQAELAACLVMAVTVETVDMRRVPAVPAVTVVPVEAAARSVTAVTAVPFNSMLQHQHAEVQEPRSLLTPHSAESKQRLDRWILQGSFWR